ncbi:hypothetical protein BASA50_003930 [Batrachochytrium salamandrivorans]|uniref:Uncharacterized protein n=1 Tax=Batrachochytrium salamandrivorans TaxID=1357716 RepID=A0ABQ8FGR7_9FUNG|nr:hypothetical protein BASA50_003930 [Batrachochytrium salamandrivorans]
MKLISFIAISFLAITVSAWPPRSPRQFSQDEIQAEIERLKAKYKKEEEIFAPMDDDVKIKRQTAIVLIDGVNSIIAELEKTGLDRGEKSELDRQYHVAKAEVDVLNSEYHRQYSSYANARQKYTDAKAALGLLMGNQEQITDYHDKYGVQTGLSLGSFYSIGFLEHQKDKILKDLETLLAELEKIKGLLAEWTRIKADKDGPRSDLRAQRIELKDKIRLLQSQRDIAVKILRKYERSQPIGTQIMKSLYPYLPNGPIE